MAERIDTSTSTVTVKHVEPPEPEYVGLSPIFRAGWGAPCERCGEQFKGERARALVYRYADDVCVHATCVTLEEWTEALHGKLIAGQRRKRD